MYVWLHVECTYIYIFICIFVLLKSKRMGKRKHTHKTTIFCTNIDNPFAVQPSLIVKTKMLQKKPQKSYKWNQHVCKTKSQSVYSTHHPSPRKSGRPCHKHLYVCVSKSSFYCIAIVEMYYHWGLKWKSRKSRKIAHWFIENAICVKAELE